MAVNSFCSPLPSSKSRFGKGDAWRMKKNFENEIQEIGRLIAGLDGIADEQARTSTRELVQRIMELHGAGIERMMEIIFSQGAAGAELIDLLGADPTISSLLVLHGLHPEPMEARVQQAIAQIAKSCASRMLKSNFSELTKVTSASMPAPMHMLADQRPAQFAPALKKGSLQPRPKSLRSRLKDWSRRVPAALWA